MNQIKKQTRQTLDFGERRERSRAALRDLFNEARKLDETGVAQSLDHGKAQEAKDYYPRWIKETREGVVWIASIAAALLFFFTRPGGMISVTGDERIDGVITVAAYLGFWAFFYFVAEKDLPKMEYVKRMLGPIPQVGKKEEQDRYYRGLRFHIFGEREDVFQWKKFAAWLLVTFSLAAAAVWIKDEVVSRAIAGLAAIAFFMENLATYWEEREVKNEDNGNE